MKTTQELWESLAGPAYPTLNPRQLQTLKQQAAMEWCAGGGSDHAKLFDKYVMLKSLVGVTEDK